MVHYRRVWIHIEDRQYLRREVPEVPLSHRKHVLIYQHCGSKLTSSADVKVYSE